MSVDLVSAVMSFGNPRFVVDDFDNCLLPGSCSFGCNAVIVSVISVSGGMSVSSVVVFVVSVTICALAAGVDSVCSVGCDLFF